MYNMIKELYDKIDNCIEKHTENMKNRSFK